MKKCTKCKISREVAQFCKSRTRKDGLYAWCKSCTKEYSIKNKEKIQVYQKQYSILNQEKLRSDKQQYYQTNKFEFEKKRKRYYEDNKEKILKAIKKYTTSSKGRLASRKASKIYFLNNKEKKAAYFKKYRESNKLLCDIRALLCGAFSRRGYKKNTKTYKILGCTYDQFVEHLSKQFKLGMTIENHGLWHIDHIIPMATAKNEKDIIRLNHYTNLQPLWAEENLKKGARIQQGENYVYSN